MKLLEIDLPVPDHTTLLHIGIDAGNGEIVAFDLTDKDVDDAFHVPTLLDQLTQDPASFMADGAYDRAATYDAILARNPSARFIVPPCKGSVPGPTAPSRQPSVLCMSLRLTNMGG